MVWREDDFGSCRTDDMGWDLLEEGSNGEAEVRQGAAAGAGGVA